MGSSYRQGGFVKRCAGQQSISVGSAMFIAAASPEGSLKLCRSGRVFDCRGYPFIRPPPKHAAPTELGDQPGTWYYKHGAPSGALRYDREQEISPFPRYYKHAAPTELGDQPGTWYYKHGAPNGAFLAANSNLRQRCKI